MNNDNNCMWRRVLKRFMHYGTLNGFMGASYRDASGMTWPVSCRDRSGMTSPVSWNKWHTSPVSCRVISRITSLVLTRRIGRLSRILNISVFLHFLLRWLHNIVYQFIYTYSLYMAATCVCAAEWRVRWLHNIVYQSIYTYSLHTAATCVCEAEWRGRPCFIESRFSKD